MAEPELPTERSQMSRAHRAYVIAVCAIIGGAFAYAACDWGSWPRIVYVPLSGKLVVGPTSAVSVQLFGIIAWGSGGASVGALLGAVLCRVRSRPWSPRAYQLFGAWAITALLLAGGYFTWGLWPW